LIAFCLLSGFNPFHFNSSAAKVDSFLRHINHTDEQIHDREIDLGADMVLYRLLLDVVSDENGHLAYGSPSNFSFRQRQKIGIICRSIEMLYRCSKEKAEKSFKQIGIDLLDALTIVLSTELHAHGSYRDRDIMSSNSHQHAQTLPELSCSNLQVRGRHDYTIKAVTRVVASFARIKSATTAMATHGRLITLLEAIIDCTKGMISFESQHNALWVLANVACDKTNSLLLIHTNKRLLHTLICVASNPGDIMEQNSWSYCYQAVQVQRTALRCILNLSFVEKASDQMLPRCGALLSSISQIITLPSEPFRHSPRVHEIIVQIKRYGVGILHNLSNTSDDNKQFLCRFERNAIMRSLKDAANDADAIVQGKATQTLANLVIFNRVQVGPP
jgi:hypothetical protein